MVELSVLSGFWVGSLEKSDIRKAGSMNGVCAKLVLYVCVWVCLAIQHNKNKDGKIMKS